MMSKFKLPKWAVVIAAALLFLPLAVDWVAPGDVARMAELALRASCESANYQLPTTNSFPLWRWLVGLAGKDIVALGGISVCAGLLCVWLVAAIFGAVFGAAVHGTKQVGVTGEGNYRFVESAAVLLSGLAFALTPGFLAAATRISPLMVALVPPLAAVALVAGVFCGMSADETVPHQWRSWGLQQILRLKKGKWRLLLALGLVGYSAYELMLARRVFLALAFPAVGVWLAVGVMPALVIARCVRKRWIGATIPEADEEAPACKPAGTGKLLWWCFAVWGAAVAVLGVVSVFSGKLNEGRVASRLVAAIIANAEESGKIAIASDGGLDELFFFMLPERVKLISLARERDTEYGRELAAWVREEVKVKVEDLAFAAELGPRALIDEWVKLDKIGFEARVATVATYFPTRAKWDEARAMLKEGCRGGRDRTERKLRHLVAVTGNALGCRFLEEGRKDDAWSIFWTIMEDVDKENYAVVLNLIGMANRGYDAGKRSVEIVQRRCAEIEERLKAPERIFAAARAGGRLYAAPEDIVKYERMRREAAEKRGLSAEARAFVETVAAAPKDPKSGRAAQAAIHKAIREGKVRSDAIGGRLITIDLALGDFENAEKDAIDVLKLDRHDPTANAAIGALAGKRGDYERAERYLKRAIATGKASVAAKNDLAYVLMRRGRLDEAEAFAREAVKGYGEAWVLRETLAAILIRQGKIEEGERELQKAEELADKAGIPKGEIASIAIDRARLFKAKDDRNHFKLAMRQLKVRKDLTDEQKAEVKAMDW